MSALRRRLTYANVIATLALFLALSGGVVWAAGKVGTKSLKSGAVTAGKLSRNAVTAVKIKPNAVTGTKIKNGAVNFTKLAAGTNVVARATSSPVPVSGTTPVNVPLSASFVAQPATLNLLSIEAKGALQRVGAEPCEPLVVPFVNGNEWNAGEGALKVRAFAPTPDRPTGLVPVSGATGPLGLTSPGATQTISAKVFGDPRCTSSSNVTVAVAVTQLK